MTNISYINSNDDTIYIQVEPFAASYMLRKGETIIIAFNSNSNASHEIEERQNTRYITLLHTDEFYIVNNGIITHWTEFPTNV